MQHMACVCVCECVCVCVSQSFQQHGSLEACSDEVMTARTFRLLMWFVFLQLGSKNCCCMTFLLPVSVHLAAKRPRLPLLSSSAPPGLFQWPAASPPQVRQKETVELSKPNSNFTAPESPSASCGPPSTQRMCP